MSLKCILGIHQWEGCMCQGCRKTRDEGHDWKDCKCRKCGLVRHQLTEFECVTKCEKCTYREYKSPHHWENELCRCCGDQKERLNNYLVRLIAHLSDTSLEPVEFHYVRASTGRAIPTENDRRRFAELAALKQELADLNTQSPAPTLTTGKALTAVEADGLLSEIPLGFAGWEEVNLSACFIDYALKNGLAQYDFASIRKEAKSKYSTLVDKRRVVSKAIDILLAEYNKPNTYAPNKGLVQKAQNALR
jgi:hypothetical protein